MSDGVLYSFSSQPSSWAESEPLASVYGPKGARLLCLPRAWTPPFALIPAGIAEALSEDSSKDRHRLADLLQPLVSHNETTKKLIVRSSVIGETIWDRGTYESHIIDVTSKGVDIAKFRRAINAVAASAKGRKSGLVVQSHVSPYEWGEIGNLLRVSRTRDHWELSAQAKDKTYRTSRLNSQRDAAPPNTKSLAVRSGLSRERFFGSIGAWINNELIRGMTDRVNCEWVLSGQQFFIVQIDAEDDDIHGVNPIQVYVPPSIIPDNHTCKIVRYPTAAEINAWDKLKVLDELWEEESAIRPSLYFFPLSEILENFDASLLETELKSVFERDIVIRTSVRADHEKLTNLPRSGCLSPKEAVAWCKEKSQKLSQEHPSIEFAFVLHRYMASRASAWARAEPDNPVVEIHGNWGLPDALQYYPYDIWEVHVPSEKTTEYPDYKSDVIFPDKAGTWRHERVKNEVARFQSLSRAQVIDIARRTLNISHRLSKPCHVMWFIGCTNKDGLEVNLPWYWTEAHAAEKNPDRGNPDWFVIEDYEGLEHIAELKSGRRNLAIDLKPVSSNLLRNNDFLKKVANIAQPLGVPVRLHGSTLAHTYFQLRKHGCTIIAAGEKQRLRVRQHETFGKLVRDKIPLRIEQNKEHQTTGTLPPTSRIPFLIAKFFEELLEVREAKGDKQKLEELSDVYEVFRAIASNFGMSIESIIEAADRKRDKVGGFEEGQFLLETSLPTKKKKGSKKLSVVGPQPIIKKIGGKTFIIPFTYFGFAEFDRPFSLSFEEERIFLVAKLLPDCIEISIQEKPEQIEIDFDFSLNLDETIS